MQKAETVEKSLGGIIMKAKMVLEAGAERKVKNHNRGYDRHLMTTKIEFRSCSNEKLPMNSKR
jgi:hypothetical protein